MGIFNLDIGDGLEDLDKSQKAQIEAGKKWNADYLNSPMYKTRLKKQGYSEADADKEIRKRKQNLENTGLVHKKVDNPDDWGAYAYGDNVYVMDNPEYYKNRLIGTHEYSHATTAQKDPFEIEDYPELFTPTHEKFEGFTTILSTDVTRPTEIKARLDELRKASQDMGIYDSFTEEFSEENMGRLYDYIWKHPDGSNDPAVQRFLRPYMELKNISRKLKSKLGDEETVIWMLNNIAKADVNTDKGLYNVSIT